MSGSVVGRKVVAGVDGKRRAESLGRANRQRLSENTQKPHFPRAKIETSVQSWIDELEVGVAAIEDKYSSGSLFETRRHKL